MKISWRSWLSQKLGRSIEVGVTCRARHERVGSTYGGWMVCPDLITESSVVYSAGIGNDISFDLGLIQRWGCQVYAFDPTPRCKEWLASQQTPAKFHYIAKAFAGKEGSLMVYPLEGPGSVNHTSVPSAGAEAYGTRVECVTVSGIMQALAHDHIDLLKMDIEGSEYDVISHMLARGLLPTQLLVEFHHRFSGVGLRPTKEAVRMLKEHGYQILHATTGAREISFVHARGLELTAQRGTSLTLQE